jgi:hypothetical protein
VAPALNLQPLTDEAYIDTRPLRVGFVVQKVPLGQVFLLVVQFYLVSALLPMHHTHISFTFTCLSLSLSLSL